MDRPTFSQSWSRVSRLTPKLRPHVQITRQLFRGEPWHVVHDPVSNNFFRLNPVAYHLVGMLDGKRSVDEVWRITLDRYGDEAPTQHEVIGLLGQLNQSNLLRVDLPADAQPLLERSRRRRIRHWAGQAMSILFMKIPLFNPDKLISWVFPLVRPVMNRWGMLAWFIWIIFCASVFLPNLRSFLGDAESVLAPANWGWMVVLFIVTKAFHELGHGLMCKRFGGVVPEFGIMMLVLFPAPFVDATSSWSFSDKWQRLLVAAAGMIFELVLAGIAAVVWVYTDDPLLKQLSYNVVFLASVTTILFNANPLLRFDGYYMLSDLMEIPNLYERAQRHLKWLVLRYAYGLTSATPVTSSGEEMRRLTIYGIGSQVYRVLVLFGIIMFIGGQFVEIGLLIAGWSLIAWGVIPLCKFFHWLWTSPALAEHRLRAVSVTVGFLAITLGCLGMIPAEDHRRAEGVVESVDRADVSVLTEAFVSEVHVEAGDHVEKDQILLVTDNPEMRTRLVDVQAQLTQLRVMHRKGLSEDLVSMHIATAKIKALEDEEQRIKQRLAELIIRSPRAGTIVAQGFMRQLVGRYLERGKVIARVEDLDNVRVTALVSQQDNTTPFIQEIERVELRTAGMMSKVIPGELIRINNSGRSILPHPALSPQGGGTIPLDPEDREGRRTLRPQFELWVAMHPERMDKADQPGYKALPGQRVHVRFTLSDRRPMLFQWIHQLRQVVRERLRA